MQADKTSSTAVAERPRDASCLSVVSFNGTKRRIVLYCKGVFIATQLNSTQLDVELSTRSQREQQLTQFIGHDVINKNTTDLAVRCSTGSVELSCVTINTP